MSDTEITTTQSANSGGHGLMVRALKEQGLDLYWVDFTRPLESEDEVEADWILKYRFKLAEWSELEECMDGKAGKGLMFTFSQGLPQVKGSKDLLTWIDVNVDKKDDFASTEEAWVIAHPSLRLLLTAPDAEWIE